MNTTAQQDRRYCVIGAGAAGLAALHALKQAGLEADCFEQDDDVAGHWKTDYDSLHLITSSKVTGFPEFPMPADWPMFPSRKLMSAYLGAYADEFGLREHICFATKVMSVEPADSAGPVGAGGWLVTTDDGTQRHYDGVLVANGHLRDQHIPALADGFDGKQVHSGSYRNTADIEGSRVLVVGCGNSGCDLAVDAAQGGFDAHIVVRRGHYFQPKTFFGKPRGELDFMQDFRPEEQDVITRLMMRLSVGTHDQYPGLPAPDHHTLAEGPPVVNELLLYWIRHGRITVHPALTSIEGRVAGFADGGTLAVDTILWATGFNVAFAFLDKSLFTWKGGVPAKLGAAVFAPGIEKLYFIGLTAPRGPQPPVYSMQSELAVQAIRLHNRADKGWMPITRELAARQETESQIDILRHVWLDAFAETGALLRALESGADTLSN